MHVNPDYALTILGHTKEDLVQVNGSQYSASITYRGASFSQAMKLVDATQSCSQEIRYDCRNAPIYTKVGGGHQSTLAWFARNNYKMKSWGHAVSDYKCECSKDGTCSGGKNFNCNCDKEDNVLRRDIGHIMDRSKLPIKRIEVNGATNNQYKAVKIGPLICSGKTYAPIALVFIIIL